MKVFKFGGASVNSASAVENMSHIVELHYGEPLVVVVSAMGKTTNLLEKLVPQDNTLPANFKENFNQLTSYHEEIVTQLFENQSKPILAKLKKLFSQINNQIRHSSFDYNYNYDQIVSFGEIISTTIVSEYLNYKGLKNSWLDVRTFIKTNDRYREGKVDWALTQSATDKVLKPLFNVHKMVVTQGFIAGSAMGATTTLGREGSDYSASVLSYCLDAQTMTIWKDVPGFLNADPKSFSQTVKIQQIPYNEAIELTYFGASVIHPKTLKPLQNKQIPLYVKSFITPDEEGSVIGDFSEIKPLTPLYIFKNNQILLSILPKDFSFIAEDNLQAIFGTFAQAGIKVNMMQNSALSFSVCLDNSDLIFEKLIPLLKKSFKVRYNTGLQLITIRYYNDDIINSIVGQRDILLEQRSRSTVQILVENNQ
ncbi:MAG: aspartate kinase [Bacteroidales bacterium]|nr:aspartate kinase [Bacteroidales bacterium]